MLKSIPIVFLALAVLVGGCDQEGNSNPDAPITYSKNWVTFSYPGSWQVNEESNDKAHLLSIQGPHDALFTIHIRSLDQAPALQTYAATLGSDEGLLPTGRPATSGRLHGFTQTIELDGVTYQRELHRVDSHDEAAYLVSQAPVAQAIRAQAGLDRIFTTFAFQ